LTRRESVAARHDKMLDSGAADGANPDMSISIPVESRRVSLSFALAGTVGFPWFLTSDPL
jgi:hypothetical protein